MNTIPSKYHSQIRKMIKKDREDKLKTILEIMSDMHDLIFLHRGDMGIENYKKISNRIIKEIKKL